MKDKKDKSRPLGTVDVTLNKKLSKLVRLSKNFIAQISFRIVDGANGRPIENLQQKFLRFSHSKSPEHEVFFVAKEHKESNGHYQLEMVISRDFVLFKSRPGKYNCELILGDSRIRAGLKWQIFDAFLDIPKSQPEEPSYKPRKKYEPHYEILPEIQHKFTRMESCNTNYWIFSFLFCFVCLLPLLLLIFYWRNFILNAFENVFPPSGDFLFSAPMFFNMLIVLFAFYFIFWLFGTQIGIQLQFAAVFAISCCFAAHRMLKSLANERIMAEKERIKSESSQNEFENEDENGTEENEEEEEIGTKNHFKKTEGFDSESLIE
ncbi:hypothetical protein niasHS_005735 [Heterodera schachtii]|uniref:Dolichyl-diphosphooligosaccharide--protein glycosyltransferase subunit 2 n=1 Tax=Heterodera schachtii TaxID=97005 RepID=A0ABD2JZ99_HETSC